MSQKEKKKLRGPGDIDDLISNIVHSIAKILVSMGYSSARLNELTKSAFVIAAQTAIQTSKSRPSIARIAALTGLTRLEVSRLLKPMKAGAPGTTQQSSRVGRVAGGWVSDRKFSHGGGVPRRLRLQGTKGSFSALVRQYSGDIPTRAMLAEMTRLGMVRVEGDGQIVLVRGNIATSRQTLEALKAVVPWVRFLASARAEQRSQNLTTRTDTIEMSFDSLPQLFAAMRELRSRHMAFIQGIQGLGDAQTGSRKYTINLSVALGATQPSKTVKGRGRCNRKRSKRAYT